MSKLKMILISSLRVLFIVVVLNELGFKNSLISNYLAIVMFFFFIIKGTKPLFLNGNDDKLTISLSQIVFYFLLMKITHLRLEINLFSLDFFIITFCVLLEIIFGIIYLLKKTSLSFYKILFHTLLLIINFLTFKCVFFFGNFFSELTYNNIISIFVFKIIFIMSLSFVSILQFCIVGNNKVLNVRNLIFLLSPVIGLMVLWLRYKFCIDYGLSDFEKANFILYYFLPHYIIMIVFCFFKFDIYKYPTGNPDNADL